MSIDAAPLPDDLALCHQIIQDNVRNFDLVSPPPKVTVRIHSDWACAAWAKQGAWSKSEFRGVMGANAAVSMSEITDGTSHTIAAAEIRSGIFDFDPRGVWALGGAGSSAL